MVLGLSFSADAHWPSLTGLSFDGAFGKAKQATPDSTQLSSTPDSTQVSSTLDSNGTFAFAPEAFPVPGVRKQERRAHPTFLLPAEPPSWGPLYDAKPFRERIKDWNRQVVGDLNALPYVVYVNIIFKMAAYWYVFARYLRTPEALFSEENIKRFIIYNILGDVLGLNSTGGPLGFRVKYFYVTWYNMLRPGSITCPLIPGWPAKRQAWQSAGYALYLYFLVSALRSEVVGFAQIAPILGTLAVLTPFDFITFQASRGEHYVYMLVGCLVPWTQTLPTLRLCQACLWFWAGTAKIGPWMKYVNAFMMPNSKLLALLQALGVPVSKLLYKDLPRDVNPSRVLEVLASFAVAGEVLLGPLCLFAPVLGVPLALCFHTYILSMTPFASVQEWNLYCIFMVLALFSATGAEAGFAGYSLASFRDAVGGLHPLLSVFLLLVLAAVPLYGQLYPKDVPFLTAMRPYAGNVRSLASFAPHPPRRAARHRVSDWVWVCSHAVFAHDGACRSGASHGTLSTTRPRTSCASSRRWRASSSARTHACSGARTHTFATSLRSTSRATWSSSPTSARSCL